MPLTSKGEKIKSAMEEQYGSKKGEEVFYASRNKGTITGVDVAKDDEHCEHIIVPDRATDIAAYNAKNRSFWRKK